MEEILVVSRNKSSFIRAMHEIDPNSHAVSHDYGMAIIANGIRYVRYSRNQDNLNGFKTTAKVAYCVEDWRDCEAPYFLQPYNFEKWCNTGSAMCNNNKISIAGVLRDPQDHWFSDKIFSRVFNSIGT